jgi:imidazole glycerol-phosphate synthase subunit HisH
MTVVIDYDLGNVGSLLNMLKKAGVQAKLSGDPEVIAQATRLFLPGVGAFDNGMGNLERLGILPALTHAVQERKVPIMGICLGFQLLTRSSEEGVLPGLGWLDAETTALRNLSGNQGLRVPHMGWSSVQMADDPLFAGLGEDTRFYFVHTYGVNAATCRAEPLCISEYGTRFVSGARSGNVMGFQFHPEKSHRFGLQLLRNFCSHE